MKFIGKTTENVRKHRDIKLENEASRNHPGLLILELSKILVYQIWNGCVKPNLAKKQNRVIWIYAYITFYYGHTDIHKGYCIPKNR